jgi:integrase
MTAGTVSAGTVAPLRSAHVPDDVLVLAGRSLRPGTGPGPRFRDDVWDLSPACHVVNAPRAASTIRFDKIGDPVWRLTAKEYAYARLTRPVEGSKRRPSPRTLANEVRTLGHFFTHLRQHRPGMCLDGISDDEILDGFIDECRASARWQALARAQRAWTLTLLHRLGDQLTYDRLSHVPWRGHSPRQVAGRRADIENATPRIPPDVLGPYLRGALFYVGTAAPDILAATAEASDLAGTRPRGAGEGPGYVRDRLADFIERRRAEGRGLPATAPWAAQHGDNGIGVNVTLIAKMIGVPRERLRKRAFREMIRQAVAETGSEPGGMDTPVSQDPDTGKPWRDRFCPRSVTIERTRLMLACYVVIAYLSGMRDSECHSLRKGCYFREQSDDGVITRHKVRGTVFKGRKPTGESATWVVIEPVAEAIDVLEQIASGDYLFTRSYAWQKDPMLADDTNKGLNVLRERLNQVRPHDPVPDVDGEPWRFTTRQFRRTVAWHIAHQPFGVVAGKIQYKHAQVAIFEGYAGSSASGFPAEIEDERQLARLETFLDRYEDYKASAVTTPRLSEQFARIRDELDDFPGRVVDPGRLRAMLFNAARTYFPGILNDCYFDAATALCIRHQRGSSDKLPGQPVVNRCQPALCRNSCVTEKHVPAIMTIIRGNRELLSVQKLSRPQRTALQENINAMEAMLAPLGGPA